MASQSGVASSGPFTFQVPVATAGVEKEYPVMCPTCPSVPAVACTGPSKAHLPTSATRSGPAHKSGIRPVIHRRPLGGQPHRPWFPVAFRPPAFASWASCSRREFRSPHGRPTGWHPDPDGVSTFRTHKIRPGWVPSLSRDGGALPAGRHSPAGTRRLLQRPVLYPAKPSHLTGGGR